MASLLDTLTGLVGQDSVAHEAERLQEPPSNVARAFQSSFPSILTGLLAKSGEPGLMRSIFSMLTGPSTAPLPNDTLPSLGATPAGGSFLASIFGSRMAGVEKSIADASGVRPSSAGSILSLAAPLVMSVLGQNIQRSGLSMYGLIDWLSGQRRAITAAAPAALAPALGLNSLANVGSNITTAAHTAAAVAQPRRWLPVALLALAGLALFGWLRSRHEPVTTIAGRVPTLASDTATNLGAWTVRMLPGHVELRVPASGVESRVIAFIQDTGKQPDTTSWFDFDRLRFDTNAATLRPESQEQLRNVADILKAYPNVKVKVGGYTDNSGDAAANQQLSEERADTVRRQLVEMGIAPDRVVAQGYGAEHPVADNSTEAGRAANRRISMLVVSK
jgi:outer membrane protein OmpA-like peptidoglycan-associated protein